MRSDQASIRSRGRSLAGVPWNAASAHDWRLVLMPVIDRHRDLDIAKPTVLYHRFEYQAGGWDKPRTVAAKVEWHRDELFPRVGFVVTNMRGSAKLIADAYNGRGRAKVDHHARYVTFQLTEVVGPRNVFAAILARIRRWAVEARAAPPAVLG